MAAWNVDVLASQLAGIMSWIELVDPPDELTAKLAAIGTELATRFGR